MKMPPWSYSSLTKFETCPRQYYEVRVAKSVVEPQGEAALAGERDHLSFENRLLHKTPLPPHLLKHEGIVRRVESAPGELLVEKELAITAKFKPCDWKAEDVWCRGIVDLGVVNGTSGTLLDWKTGKRKPDSTQLALFAGLGFVHYPRVKTFKTGFVWLKTSQLDKDVFTREHTSDIWREFLPRVHRMEQAFEHDKWPARPSGLCRKHCAVTSCPHNGLR